MKIKSFLFIKRLLICFIILGVTIVILNVITHKPIVYISEDALTVNQLIPYCDGYIRKYNKNKDLYLSNIGMHIDENHMGKVTMTYTHEKKGVFKRYNIEIDTLEHRIDSMEWIDKSVPASIRFMNFEEWNIDSDEAVKIALVDLQNKGYDVDDSEISIDARRTADLTNSWSVSFYADANFEKYGKAFTVRVDPYTGEIMQLFKTN